MELLLLLDAVIKVQALLCRASSKGQRGEDDNNNSDQRLRTGLRMKALSGLDRLVPGNGLHTQNHIRLCQRALIDSCLGQDSSYSYEEESFEISLHHQPYHMYVLYLVVSTIANSLHCTAGPPNYT